MNVQHVGDEATLERLFAHAVATGHGFAGELFLAAGRREISVAFVFDAAAPAPMKILNRATLPTLVVLGDDPGDAGRGPGAWLSTRRLINWAAFGVMHAAAGTVADYRLVVALTKLHRRVLLVETTTKQADAWGAALLHRRPRPLPCIGFLPAIGPHPVTAPQAGTAQ